MDARTDPGFAGLTNGRHEAGNASEEELDALADLFLGPATTSPPPKARPTDRTSVEALVLGHLPVYAGAWPTQLARHLADEARERVALVRWEPDALAVHLVSPAGSGPARSGLAGLALIRVPEAAEPDLAIRPEVERISILTGADDAAIVACYRRLKYLASAASERGRALPAARLVVMGAPAEKAQLAHERVLRAARAFLEADLLEPVVIPRISPVQASALRDGPCMATLAEVVSMLALGRLAELTPAPAAAPDEDRSTPRAAPTTPTTTTTPAALPAPQAARAPFERAATAPAKPAASDGEGPVEGLVGLVPGLRALISACPGAPRVAVACDAAGGVHLVAGTLRTAPGASSPDALGDLLHAGVWARANSRLIARAEGLPPSECEPVLHLVTDSAAAAVRLVGSAVRVHLAAPAGAAAMGLVAVGLDL